MKITIALAAIALSLAPLSAFAATTTTTKPMAASTTAPLTDKSTFAQVLASLSAGTKTDLSKVTASSSIELVKLSTLKGYSAAGMKLSAADTKSMAALDASVAGNAALTAALKKAGDLPSDVAAVAVDGKGAATVFVAK